MSEQKSHETQESGSTTGFLKIILALVAVLVIGLGGLILLVLLAVGGGGGESANGCNPIGDGQAKQGITGGDTGAAPPGNLRKEQIENAKKIDQTAKKLGLSGHASRIAIITAVGESTLMNLGHGDEGAGVKNSDGSATTSKGLFQQQTSTGWGTVEQVTNPEYATESFLTGPQHDGKSGLVSIPGWETGEPTQVIHKVQSNADPNHYASFYSEADAVIKEAGIDVDAPGDPSKQGDWKKDAGANAQATKGADGTSAAGTGCQGGGTAKSGKSGDGKNTYPWDEKAPGPGVYNQDPLGFFYGECTSYASWKVNEAMGGSADHIIFNNSYGGHQKGNGAEWKSAWEDSGWEVSKTPKAGSVAWWGPGGGPGIGSAGHVAWVDEVTPDGKVVISEYNNSAYAPPGHKFDKRPHPIDASEVNAYLYVPDNPGNGK